MRNPLRGWRLTSGIAGALLAAACLSAELPRALAQAPAPKSAIPAKPLSDAEKAGTAAYQQTVDAYLKNDFAALQSHLKDMARQSLRLTPQQRADIEYIRRSSQDQRPIWWPKTKSSANTSFQSSIWGKDVMTNFIPADDLGAEAPAEIRDGRLIMVVAWRPTNVDNPRPADGVLAKTLGVTKGDIGEVVVWHELGHLYLSSQLSADANVELYTRYGILYAHLQEFFADMTAIYHATPHARRIAMVLRLDSLDPPDGKYREIEPHTRGSHGIGSMFLAEVLTNPAKWPDVHLPPAVPEGNVELKTIVYMYEHFTSQWTLAEDKAMREWALGEVHNNGDQIFRSRGMIPLPEKNTFSLMEAQDRDFQAKRNAWVAEKLEKAIAAGQADKPSAAATQKSATQPGMVITINGKVIKSGGEQRIEVPVY